MINRRTLLGALAALPFARWFVPAAPAADATISALGSVNAGSYFTVTKWSNNLIEVVNRFGERCPPDFVAADSPVFRDPRGGTLSFTSWDGLVKLNGHRTWTDDRPASERLAGIGWDDATS